MSSIEEKEKLLGEKLRTICNGKGQELFPEQSAHIFYELGLLYESKSPDKISLIQSAALLNAAILRQPAGQKFKDRLQRLCKHVLKCANATKRSSNLVEVSNRLKQMVVEMRQKTDEGLNNIKRIPESIKDKNEILSLEKNKIEQVKMLQSQIAEQYSRIMAHASEYCVDIMGPPPCRFALVGMGSLARKEITPYSDFEHVIILEELHQKKKRKIQNIYKYFRWFSVIFHILIINLQETIIPSVCISCLNDGSKPDGNWFFDQNTRGISFDGMMPHACKFPLGRTRPTKTKSFTTELIKTVSDMVKYLDCGEDLKNGYKLADILTRTCFVAGDEGLYQMFQTNILQVQNNQPQEQQIFQQLDEDFKSFDATKNLFIFTMSRSWNMKRVIYRSTSLFVSALGRIHGSSKQSNFDIIAEFAERGQIDENTAHRLSFLVAVACHIRLYHYMDRKSQDDYIVENYYAAFTPTIPLHFTNIMSRKDLIRYFCDVQLLQNHLADSTCNFDLGNCMKKSNVWFSLMLKNCINAHDEVIHDGEQYLKKREIIKEDDLLVMFNIAYAYQLKNNHSSAIKYFEQITRNSAFDKLSRQYQALTKIYLFISKITNGELEKVLKASNQILKNPKFDIYASDFHFVKGLAYTSMGHHHMALSSFRNSLAENKKNVQSAVALNPYTKRNVAVCLLGTGQPTKALTWALEATELFEPSTDLIGFRVLCLDIISSCYRFMGYTAQAKLYHNRKFEKLSGQAYDPQNTEKVLSRLFLNLSLKKDRDVTCSPAYTVFLDLTLLWFKILK